MSAIEAIPGLFFSPPEERGMWMAGSGWIADALRAGDMGSAEHTLDQIAGGMGIHDIVLGSQPTPDVGWRTDFTHPARHAVAILQGINKLDHLRHVEAELTWRGADVERLSINAMQVRGGTLFVDGKPHPMPEAVYAAVTGADSLGVLGQLDRAGVHVVNDRAAIRASSDKRQMTHRLRSGGVPIPKTKVNLRTPEMLGDAARALHFPLVLKHPELDLGRGVELVRNSDEMRHQAMRWGMRHNTPSTVPGVMAQQLIDTGGHGIRTNFGLDAVTGEWRPIAATHQIALGGDFRSNGGPEGNLVRPVYDLTGGDPFLPPELIEANRRAFEATGIPWGGSDSAIDLRTGEPVVFEIDAHALSPDVGQPLPRKDNAASRLADYILYGGYPDAPSAAG